MLVTLIFGGVFTLVQYNRSYKTLPKYVLSLMEKTFPATRFHALMLASMFLRDSKIGFVIIGFYCDKQYKLTI